MKDSIFIMIPSYRDSELRNTISSCIVNADNPDSLRFGICHQHDPVDEWDTLDEYANDPRFHIDDVAASQSKGASWARSRAQRLYNGETYTLMIDAHMRFDKGWDTFLIKELNATGSTKPILTGYANRYSSTDDTMDVDTSVAYVLTPLYFTNINTIRFIPTPVKATEHKYKPIAGMFISGHFMFTIGSHCVEFNHDTRLPYIGDESRMSIVSYTLGYDIFHPHKNVLWHEYVPEGRNTSKKINADGTTVSTTPMATDTSISILRSLFGISSDKITPLGLYGLGTIRSVDDYAKYCGVNFKGGVFHIDAISGARPPINKVPNKCYYEDKNVLLLYVTSNITSVRYRDELVARYRKEGYFIIMIIDRDIPRITIDSLYPKKCVLLNISANYTKIIKGYAENTPMVIEHHNEHTCPSEPNNTPKEEL